MWFTHVGTQDTTPEDLAETTLFAIDSSGQNEAISVLVTGRSSFQSEILTF